MNRNRLALALFIALAALMAVACAPQTVEVTRVVTETSEVEVTRIVEETVTEQVEVPVEVEVTRIVEVVDDGPKGELIVALSTEPNSIYWPNTAERNASNVAAQLYNGLVWVDAEGKVVPALAESWEISDDGLEYTFVLRQDVVFHDGTPFTARDVVATWEAGKSPENAYGYLYEAVPTVEALDDYTVKIVTAVPDVLFLRNLATWGIIPADYFAAVGRQGLEDAPIGTGPFKFVEWSRGDRIVLEANADYWEEGLPKVARIIFRPIPDSSTRLAAIQTGEVHIVQRLSAEEAQSLLGAANARVVRYPVDRVYYIAFNNLTTGVGQPTEDARVRLAMNYAVDRAAIVQGLFDGYARISSGMVTPANLGFTDAAAIPYDPEMARTLLAEAGYPDGFTIGMACPIGAYTNFEEVCQAVANYLSEVGITAEGNEVQFMESGQFWDMEAAKELPPMFGDSWSSTVGEALPRLQGSLGGLNASYSAWSDPEIDAQLAAISQEFDQTKRAELYDQLNSYMLENPPFIYLYEPNAFEAVNTAVQNYNPRAAEDYFLKEVFIADGS